MPSLGSSPPGGATRWPAPPLFTVAIRTRPSAAARSAYSPSRPMCPQFRAVPAATPSAFAFARTRSRSRWAWTWPKPHWASQTTTAGGLVLDDQLDAGPVVAPFQEVDVLGDPHHAVRVVPPEVRLHQAGGHGPGVVGGDARGLEEAGHELGQAGGGEGGHGGSPGSGMENPILRGDEAFAIGRPRRSNRRPGPRGLLSVQLGKGLSHGVQGRHRNARRSHRLHLARRRDGFLRLDPPVVWLQPLRLAPPAGRHAPPGPGARNRAGSRRPATRPATGPRSSSPTRTGSGTGSYRFRGKDYRLPITLKPNAIHGFALDAAWDVVEHKATATEAFVTGRYQISKHSPEMRANWPSDAILQVRYGLAGRRLTMDVTVTNPTADDLPYGFGIHPYFRLPFSPGGDPAQTRVILPASKYWVLRDFLPTGERRAVDRRLDFRQGQPREGLKLDDVLTGLAFEGGECVCRLVDLGLKAELQLRFDRNFRELVVYTPAEGRRHLARAVYADDRRDQPASQGDRWRPSRARARRPGLDDDPAGDRGIEPSSPRIGPVFRRWGVFPAATDAYDGIVRATEGPTSGVAPRSSCRTRSRWPGLSGNVAASKGSIMEPRAVRASRTPGAPDRHPPARGGHLPRAGLSGVPAARGGPPPPRLARRGRRADAPVAASLRAGGQVGPAGCLDLRAEAGQLHYPHMKLQVQPWPNPAGFLLSVNTHDQVLGLEPEAADLPAFRALQAENQRLKEAIEQAWDEAGLPTFLRYLREYIDSHRRAAPADRRRATRTRTPADPGRSDRPRAAAGMPVAPTPGEAESERRAASGGALHLDPAAVQLDERLDQAEAQADAPLAVLVLARGVVHRVEAREERLEEVPTLGRSDPEPLVDHAEPDPVGAVGPGDQADGPAVGGELDGVDHQVRHDVAELLAIDLGDSQARVELDLHLLLARARNGASSATVSRIRGASSVGSKSSVWSSWSVLRSLSIRSTVAARRLPACWIRSTQPRSAGEAVSACDHFQSSVIPRTTETGVFSSWLATSMNAAFRRFASTSLRVGLLQLGHQARPLHDQVVLLDRLADHGLQLVGVPGLGDVAEDAPLVDRVDDGLDVGVGGEEQAGGLRADLGWRGAGPRRPSSRASAGPT